MMTALTSITSKEKKTKANSHIGRMGENMA